MMRIIISPAKKMNVADDFWEAPGLPRLLEKTERLKSYLQGLDYDTLKGIWKCNDKIAAQNVERLRHMDLAGRLTPAVLAYEGIQYQSMSPSVFERRELDYIGKHLYILSGFYGILGAFDGVVPYRLEMQAKLDWHHGEEHVTSLYDYWGRELYEILADGADVIVNLASKEYSRAIEPWLGSGDHMVTCVFGELARSENGELQRDQAGRPSVRVKATAAKMARGSMVRFLAEKQVEDVEQIKRFDRMGYRYLEELSDNCTYIFGK